MINEKTISQPTPGKILPTIYVDAIDLPDLEKWEIEEEQYIIAKVKVKGKELVEINKGEVEERKHLEGRLEIIGIDSIPNDFIGLLRKLKENDFIKEKVSFLKKAQR